MTRYHVLAAVLLVGYVVFAFLVSLGIYHLAGLMVQLMFVPVFFIGGIFVGIYAVGMTVRR